MSKDSLPSDATDIPVNLGLKNWSKLALILSLCLPLATCTTFSPTPFSSSRSPIEFIDYVPMDQGILQRISLYFGYEIETPPNSKPILIIYHLDLEKSLKEPLATIYIDGIVINEYSRKSMFAVSWDEKTLLYMHDQSLKAPESLAKKLPGLYEYVEGRGDLLIYPQARIISHATFKLPRNALEFAMGDPNNPDTEHYLRSTEGVETLQEETFIMQFGGTELHRASAKGDIASARQLINAGHDIEATDNRGFTPLHVALWNGHEEIAKLLINAGADVNSRMKGSLDWSPLEEAARFGLVATVTLLLDRGANLKSSSRSGNTALHVAVDYKNFMVAEILIKRGTDVNARTKDGTTPLHIFAQGARDERSLWNGSQEEALLKLFLSKRADVSAKSDKGITPLHYAVLKNNLMTAQILIKSGADASLMELPDRHYYGREIHHEGSKMTLERRMRETLNSEWWREGVLQ